MKTPSVFQALWTLDPPHPLMDRSLKNPPHLGPTLPVALRRH